MKTLSALVERDSFDVPAFVLDHFQNEFEGGGVLTYRRGGIDAEVDFGSKTWSARIDRSAFRALMAPRWGGVRAGVHVGGAAQSAGEHAVTSFTARLSFRGGR